MLAEDGENLKTQNRPIAFLAKGKFWVNNHAHILTGKDGNNTRFLCYALQLADIKSYLSGSTRPKLTQKDMRRIPLYAPNPKEQRAIAHILGTLDDKIELNREMNKTLEEMAQAIFKSWFIDFDPVVWKAVKAGKTVPEKFSKRAAYYKESGKCPIPEEILPLFPDSFEDSEFGPIPKGWEVGCVADLANVTSGKRPKKRSKNKSAEFAIPLYGGAGIMAYVQEPMMISVPFLLTGRVGTLGKIFRITEKCWPSDNTLLLFPSDKSYLDFLYFTLQRTDFKSLNRGSTQPLITQTDLKNQRIVIPDDDVLFIFRKYIEHIFGKIDRNVVESRILAETRDTLLPKLISGELRVPDVEKFLKEAGL